MNWQIIFGLFLLLGAFGNIFSNFGAFVLGLLLGGGLLYWGMRKSKFWRSILDNFSERQEADVLPSKRTLTEEKFEAVGVNYYEKNIHKLATLNPDWKLTPAKVISAGKAGRKIFKHYYINKPVYLKPEPNNKHDQNAIAVTIAGETVGYIRSDQTAHVKAILDQREIKSLSGFIGGGEYKIVSENKDVFEGEYGFSVTIKIKYI